MAKFKIDLENGIIEFLKKKPLSSSKEIYEGFEKLVGYATIKRAIQELLNKNLISTVGKGKATRYEISTSYEVISTINL